MAVIPLKDTTTAYLLWFFLGAFSAHKFYLGKTGMGVLYLLTGQLLGIGWIIDGLTLGEQVHQYNRLHGSFRVGPAPSNNQNNIVVNVATPTAAPASEPKKSAEKQILELSHNSTNALSVKQIVSQTSLEIDEAEEALKNLVAKGLAKEQAGPDGKLTYDFS